MRRDNFFGDLQALRDRPIPNLEEARQKRAGYRQHPIDPDHELRDEPLHDVTTLGIDGANHFNRSDNPPYHRVFAGSIAQLLLRRSVAERLREVDMRLRGQGLKLYVHDAYRPTAVQAYAHDVWMPERLRRDNPGLTGEALTEAVEQYWARPTTDPALPSPHLTGGAVDLTLAYAASGQTLFMGTIFDDASARSHTDSLEKQPSTGSYSDQEALANRRLLYWTMKEAGFANNPNEWWHFSWGDQMWARLTGARGAIYGAAPFS